MAVMRQFQYMAALAAVLAGALLATGCASSRVEEQPAEDTAAAEKAASEQADRDTQVRNANALTVVAEIALERGDCRSAAENYAAASRASLELAQRATEVALTCQHLPAARQSAESWRSFAPDNRDAATIYAVVALKLYQIADARPALEAAYKSAESAENPDQERTALISVLAEESDVTAAMIALDSVVDTRSATPAVLAAMGQLALQAYNFEKAESRARQALKKDPKSAAALRLLARVRALQGDAEGAISTAREVMKLEGDNAAFELAEVLVLLDRAEEAHQELERLRGGKVRAGEIDRRLALLAFETGNLEEAGRRFADLVTRGEAGDAAVFYLADIAARTGDKDAALSAYRQLVDSAFAVPARTRAAALLLENNKRAEALELLDAYAADHPESIFELTLSKAQLLSQHGDHDAGLQLLDTALQRHPAHPSILYERAVMLERAGRIDQSIEVFERLLKDRPADPTILNALGYTLADHNRQLPRAEDLIRKALDVMPDNPAALDSLAWVKVRRGDMRGSLPIFERAYRIGRDGEIAAHWGEALWLSGQQDEARRVWATALAHHPDSEPLKETLARFLPADAPTSKAP